MERTKQGSITRNCSRIPRGSGLRAGGSGYLPRAQSPEPSTSFGSFPGARFIGPLEQRSVLEVLKAQSLYRFYGLHLLRRCEALEDLSRLRWNRRYALAVSSGSAALHTALFALGVSRGDEVILPSYAWSADLMAIVALGAVPVIVPIDETLGIDVAALPSALTKRTKAILAVHMRGQPCDMRGALESGKRYGIPVVEDASQAIGATIEGKPVGTLGEISTFSFQYHKLITSGEGGMLLTHERRLHERACRFHDLGMLRRAGKADPVGKNCIRSFGLNYRLSELQAAVLIPQVQKSSIILSALRVACDRLLHASEPACRKFQLRRRPLVPGTTPNHSLLCLSAKTHHAARGALQGLRQEGFVVQPCWRLDAHHAGTWISYLHRGRHPFRLMDGARHDRFLKRTVMLDVIPRNFASQNFSNR